MVKVSATGYLSAMLIAKSLTATLMLGFSGACIALLCRISAFKFIFYLARLKNSLKKS
jgi:hypothetical protein